MISIILAVLLSFPSPPLGATLGSGTPYHTAIVSVATQTPPISRIERTQLPATGLATYYAPGVFQQVLRNRGLSADGCPDCDGFAALLWPSDVGRVVCVQGLRLWVVDSAAGHHRQGLIEKGWIVDVDRETWLRLGWPDTPTRTKVTECS